MNQGTRNQFIGVMLSDCLKIVSIASAASPSEQFCFLFQMKLGTHIRSTSMWKPLDTLTLPKVLPVTNFEPLAFRGERNVLVSFFPSVYLGFFWEPFSLKE